MYRFLNLYAIKTIKNVPCLETKSSVCSDNLKFNLYLRAVETLDILLWWRWRSGVNVGMLDIKLAGFTSYSAQVEKTNSN